MEFIRYRKLWSESNSISKTCWVSYLEHLLRVPLQMNLLDSAWVEHRPEMG